MALQVEMQALNAVLSPDGMVEQAAMSLPMAHFRKSQLAASRQAAVQSAMGPCVALQLVVPVGVMVAVTAQVLSLAVT